MEDQTSEKPLEPDVPEQTSPPEPLVSTPTSSPHHNGPYSFEKRKQAVEAFQKSNIGLEDFARLWGIGEKTLEEWVKRWEEGGPQSLAQRHFHTRGRRARLGMHEEIAEVKRKFPDFGLRKVRDYLARFSGVRVSAGTVRNALEAKGLNSKGRRKRRRKIMPARRFERARAGELWQSDITSFVLARRSQRVYLTVFLDDYSRYVVSWGLYLQQKQDIVIETLLDGIERFGKPKEVLTDQGRQYFAWRGKGDFQKLLIREGIQHVVARTHHPQTVGKTERFWATVGEEFWERVQPQDFTEAKERFGHFVAHYNHFRPHQGIDGMVPADRFFGVENQVRQALEKAMSRNELHLALGEKPRKPVFLVGQIGDQQVSMHGERGRLIFQTQDGNLQEMGLEGLGAPGGKDGNDQSRDNARGTEETQVDTPQEPAVQDAQERAQGDEGALGPSHGGGETKGARGGNSHFGELDGPSHPSADCPETGRASVAGVADVPSGDRGVGSGTLETAENQERISTLPATGGGSGEAEKADRLPGEGLGHDETAGGPTEGISSSPGGENNR